MPSSNSDVNVTRYEFDRLYEIVNSLVKDQANARVEIATMKLTIRLILSACTAAGGAGGAVFAVIKHFYP